MDSSPVIVDNASKFGRSLDPGFPFRDDEGFGRRADIRSHLDDLAARHPEFADHLLGPPWADVPFPGGGTGSLHRSRNRHNSSDRHHNHPDEDTRSQASGSSAASGASGVSSHGSEPEDESSHKNSSIPQYGLRNTVDIGQHQKNMEAPQQQRNVRSMSAPPENRNNQDGGNGPQRYVSRVEITPRVGEETAQQPGNQNKEQPQQQQPTREKSPAPQSKPQTQSSGNVRHIPIFVEGRDEPVLPKADVDETDFPRRQQSPPHFQRPSAFGPTSHGFSKPSTWSSHFQDPFFEPPSSRWGHQPTHPQYRHTTTQEKPRTQQTHPEDQYQQRQRSYSQSQPQAKKQEQPQQDTQQTPPKPKQQIQPKDPLERVAMVQKEVDALTEQVKAYTGNSRQDKQYMYLDEMLTRELIKLDDIETEGKENVRLARKQAIKSIQESISLLESKAPLPGQQQQQEEEKSQDEKMEEKSQEDKSEEIKEQETNAQTEAKASEAMDTSEGTTDEPKAIPLPPPSSPIKTTKESKKSEETSKEAEQQQEQQQQQKAEEIVSQDITQTATQSQPETSAAEKPESNETQKSEEIQQQQLVEQMESSNVTTASVPENMEAKQSSSTKELQPSTEEQKEQVENQPEHTQEASAEITEKPKKEPPPVPVKPSKSPKKAKKAAKKPEPISETAIPLPAPGQTI